MGWRHTTPNAQENSTYSTPSVEGAADGHRCADNNNSCDWGGTTVTTSTASANSIWVKAVELIRSIFLIDKKRACYKAFFIAPPLHILQLLERRN